jgi:XRE family transcriptional regulator, regulator of sulfur utilization
MTLGERLRSLRTGRKLLLKQVEEATGMAVPYLSDLERDKIPNPSLETLGKIAKVYDLAVGDLLDGVDELGGYRKGVPAELLALRQDSEVGGELTDEWVRALQSVQYRGKQPETTREWKELYFYLRRFFTEGR